MAGSQVEKEGILEQGKKLIYATSSATVPKQTVVVRKAYGAGIYAMGGPAYDPESVIGLPSGEIAIMGPEAAINAVYARKLAEIDDPRSASGWRNGSARSTARISTSIGWRATWSSTNSSRRVGFARSWPLASTSTLMSRNLCRTKTRDDPLIRTAITVYWRAHTAGHRCAGTDGQ